MFKTSKSKIPNSKDSIKKENGLTITTSEVPYINGIKEDLNGIPKSTFEVPYTNGFENGINGYASYSDSDSLASDYSLSNYESYPSLSNGNVNYKEISIIKSNGLIVKEHVNTFHCNVSIPN